MTVCVILILVEALLTASETSVFAVRESRLEQLIAEGRSSARRVLRLQTEGTLELQQIALFAHFLIHILLGAIAVGTWSLPLAELFATRGMPDSLALMLTLTLVVFPAALLAMTFGRILPRRWALRSAEDFALPLSGPFAAFIGLMKPFNPLMTLSARGVARLLGDRGDDPVDEVTEEEIKAFVAEHGSIAEGEKHLIHSVFEFGDVSVGELMVPRIDIDALEESRTIDEALEFFRASGYSRAPVYQENIDHIVGIVNLKDILNAWITGRKGDKLGSCLYRTLIVPEQKKALELLREMQRERQQMAIVTDEFGGTAGLITVEDLVEQVVGEIRDETDDEEQDEISVISPLEVRALGAAPVHNLNSELGWKLPEAEDYDTLGGLVFSQLGRIPQEGDRVAVDGYLLEVEKMDRRRIELLHITVLPRDSQTGES